MATSLTLVVENNDAGVAELADAQDLGSCGLKTVEVQILSPAPAIFPILSQ
jgi:hypothetical protein